MGRIGYRGSNPKVTGHLVASLQTAFTHLLLCKSFPNLLRSFTLTALSPYLCVLIAVVGLSIISDSHIARLGSLHVHCTHPPFAPKAALVSAPITLISVVSSLLPLSLSSSSSRLSPSPSSLITRFPCRCNRPTHPQALLFYVRVNK